MTPQEQYNNFWQELSLAYPISHGELRLPIATNFLEKNISNQATTADFQNILDQIFDLIKSETIQKIFEKNSDSRLIPLISNEFTGIIRFDCMINSHGELKIIELNADYPDGLILHDSSVSVI